MHICTDFKLMLTTKVEVKKLSTFQLNWRIIKIAIGIHPMRIVIQFVGIMASLCQTLLQLLFFKAILDAIIGQAALTVILQDLIFYLIAYSLFTLYSYWMNDAYLPKSNVRISRYFQDQLFQKAVKIDLECYDQSLFYNSYIWTMKDMDTRAIQVLETPLKFIGSVLTGGVMIAISMVYEPLILIPGILYLTISIILDLSMNKRQYQYDQARVQAERKKDYPKRVYYLPQYAKELRLTGISNVVSNIYEEAVKEYRDIIHSHGKGIARLQASMSIAYYLLASYVPYTLLGIKALSTKAYSVGTFSALIGVINSFTHSLQQIMRVFPEMRQHSMYIQNYYAFINQENRVRSNGELKVDSTAHELELVKVSFGYQSTNRILNKISLHIKRGEKIAIVGPNGAGKSTLIKLILRLYEPSSGQILLDGQPIEQIEIASYRNQFGSIFQDFQLYAASLGENVLMDLIHNSDEDIARIETSLQSAGIGDSLQRRGISTVQAVTKEFDEEGLIFSGGEAQKIALARIYAQQCGVLLLDEPSSALDPVSEFEMHQRLLEAAKNKTVIFISHRLLTVRNADRIYYMEQGEITESGTHEELLALNGKYAAMYRLQAKKYGPMQ